MQAPAIWRTANGSELKSLNMKYNIGHSRLYSLLWKKLPEGGFGASW
jgi:hypothetical protein